MDIFDVIKSLRAKDMEIMSHINVLKLDLHLLEADLHRVRADLTTILNTPMVSRETEANADGEPTLF